MHKTGDPAKCIAIGTPNGSILRNIFSIEEFSPRTEAVDALVGVDTDDGTRHGRAAELRPPAGR
jgi:hypothetical protein